MKQQEKHPDELTLLRMAEGELSAERHAATRGHVVECARCQGAYEALKAESEILRSILREDEDPLPDTLRSEGGLGWFLLGAIALGGLGLAQFWKWFVDPLFRGMERVGIDGSSVFTTVVIRGLLYRGWSDMASFLTHVALYVSLVVAIATVAFLAWRRLRTSASLALLAIVLLVSAARPAKAAVIELDREMYVLPADETIANDLIVAGEIVRIEGTVEGDLIVAARLVEVTGRIGGDLLGFAEEFEVRGEVGGNVRTASRSLQIDGPVARNVSSAGETLRIGPGANVGGSFIAAAREAILGGPVGRDLLVAAQTHQLDSRLTGSALLVGETLSVGEGAVVDGAIEFHGAHEPEIAEGATLASPVVFEPVEEEEDQEGVVGRLLSVVFFWAAAFVLGAAFVLVAPETAHAVTAVHLPQYGKSLLVGLLAVGGVAALALAFMVTIVGLPLGVVTLFFWALGLYLAQVYAGLYVGSLLLGPPADRTHLLVQLAVGLLALHIAKSLPFLGPIVTVVVALWGFGALTLWILDRMSRKTEPPPLPRAQEAA